MKNLSKKQKIFASIGAVALIAVAYFVYEHIVYVSTDNAQVEAHAVMLAAKVSGFVTAVHVDEGQAVKKGDVLIEIDPSDYENALTATKAELTSVEAKQKDAEKNYKRISSLYSHGAVSQQQFDSVQSSYSAIKAKYDGLSAKVAQAELNLKNTKVIAPSDGTIAKRSVEVGQLIAQGVPMLGFVSNDERWVEANFKETELSGVQIDDKAWVTVDAIPGRTFKGHVQSISSATGSTFTLLPPDNASGNFTKVVQWVPVKIVFDHLKESDMTALRSGLSAVVVVPR